MVQSCFIEINGRFATDVCGSRFSLGLRRRHGIRAVPKSIN